MPATTTSGLVRIIAATIVALAAMLAMSAPSALAGPCPQGQAYLYTGLTLNGVQEKECRSCDNGSIPSPDQMSCIKCTGNTVSNWDYEATACIPCPDNKVATSEHTSCYACTNGFAPNAAHTDCICPPGKITEFLPPQGKFCVGCPAPTVANKAQTLCEPCPTGTTFTFGTCVRLQRSAVPPWVPQTRPGGPAPGLLENAAPLGSSGPAGTGTPLGGGSPAGGGGRPGAAGIR